MVPAHMEHQVRVPGKVGFQREQHENIVKVCTAYCHLGKSKKKRETYISLQVNKNLNFYTQISDQTI